MGGGGKYNIVAAAIDHRYRQRRCHRRRWLNPITATIDDNRYHCRQQPPLPLLHSHQQQPPETSGCRLL
jgi:hypothetical protein